jgi:hypothetical protein
MKRLACMGALAGALVVASSGAQAQEVNAALGGLRGSTGGESTYTWSFGYRQALTQHFGLGLSWLNEGHIPDNHRDGVALQGWYNRSLFDPRFSIGLGAGPYRYYDTQSCDGCSYSDDHGWAMLYTVTANWAATPHLDYQLRFNRVQAAGSANTSSILFGLVYRLPESVTAPASADSAAHARSVSYLPPGDELTLLAGQTVVNSLQSESTFAKSIEYRHAFSRHVEGTVSWIDEGETTLTRRNGVAAQLWMNEPLFSDRLTLGFGLGPYVAYDRYLNDNNQSDSGTKLSGLLTMSVAYRVTNHIVGRLSWNRVVSHYDRDTDMFMVGVGYRF